MLTGVNCIHSFVQFIHDCQSVLIIDVVGVKRERSSLFTPPTGKGPPSGPPTRRRDYTSQQACERLRLPEDGRESESGEGSFWNTLLILLPPPQVEPRMVEGWARGLNS